MIIDNCYYFSLLSLDSFLFLPLVANFYSKEYDCIRKFGKYYKEAKVKDKKK